MNNSKITSYMIILGILILGVFTYVTALNILDDNTSSNPFFSKTESEVNATIEDVTVTDNKLIITTSGDAQYACAKTTKTPPTTNSVCWTQIQNNNASLSIYTNKTYYIWIKDSSNTISETLKYNNKGTN